MGAGRRQHCFRMDADFRPRTVDETAGRAPLKGEHSVTACSTGKPDHDDTADRRPAGPRIRERYGSAPRVRCRYWCAHPLVARSGNLLEVGEGNTNRVKAKHTGAPGRPTGRLSTAFCSRLATRHYRRLWLRKEAHELRGLDRGPPDPLLQLPVSVVSGPERDRDSGRAPETLLARPLFAREGVDPLHAEGD